jgi:hypothetical protein
MNAYATLPRLITSLLKPMEVLLQSQTLWLAVNAVTAARATAMSGIGSAGNLSFASNVKLPFGVGASRLIAPFRPMTRSKPLNVSRARITGVILTAHD